MTGGRNLRVAKFTGFTASYNSGKMEKVHFPEILPGFTAS